MKPQIEHSGAVLPIALQVLKYYWSDKIRRAVWTKSGKGNVPEGTEPERVFNCEAKYLNTRGLAMMEKGSGLIHWQEKCHIISDMNSWELSFRRRMNEEKFTRFFTD